MKTAVLMSALSLLAATTASTAGAAPAAPIRLVTVVQPGTALYAQFAKLIDAVFSQLQQPYSLVYEPAGRATASFKAGRFDGDISRSAQFRDVFPEAIEITPPVYAIPIVALSSSPALSLSSWKDLEPYRVAYRRGFQAMERNLQNVAGRYAVDSDDSCLTMVSLKRMDVCVGDEALLQSSRILKQGGVFHVDHIATVPSYFWLGPGHAELAIALGQVLSTMDKNGSLAHFFDTDNDRDHAPL